MVDGVVFLLENYFDGDCLTLFTLRLQATELELLLLKQLHKMKAFYLLRPVVNIVTKVPFPCFYIILLGEKDYLLDNDPAKINSKFFLNKETELSKYIVIAQNKLNFQQKSKALITLFRRGHPDALLLNPEDNLFAYTLFPFGEKMKNCPENGIEIKLLDKWVNNRFHKNLYPHKVPQLFNGCNLDVSFIEYVPYTIYHGRNEVKGIDGVMVKLIGESLNMTVRWLLRESWFSYLKNGSHYGILPDILYGRTHLACGGLIRSPELAGYVHFTTTYAISYLTWYLPQPPYEQTWKTMYKAFQKKLLLLSIAVIFTIPVFIAIIAKLADNELSLFKCITRCYVAAWALAVGNSTGKKPRTTSVRIIYAVWMIYAMHLALAYTASLAGLLTKSAHRPRVKNFNDLINTGLPTAMLDVHQSATTNISDPEVRQALDKFLLIEDTDEAISLMALHGNMSILDNSAYVDYTICSKFSKKPIYNSGLSTFPMKTGLMMRKSHFLYKIINKMIIRLVESGINDKIIKSTTKCRKTSRRLKSGQFKASTLRGLSGAFLVLGVGLLVAIAVFFLEQIIYQRNLYRNDKEAIIPYLN
uniref:Ionotropic glutamate receptor C-terminal domain-containing protein n=1 Tax=Rhodnius prolixus TaxID=13249 RepID=T1HNN5_RHOPR